MDGPCLRDGKGWCCSAWTAVKASAVATKLDEPRFSTTATLLLTFLATTATLLRRGGTGEGGGGSLPSLPPSRARLCRRCTYAR